MKNKAKIAEDTKGLFIIYYLNRKNNVSFAYAILDVTNYQLIIIISTNYLLFEKNGAKNDE